MPRGWCRFGWIHGPANVRVNGAVAGLRSNAIASSVSPRSAPNLAPGSEWRRQRDWFERPARAAWRGADFGLAEIHKLYATLDQVLPLKEKRVDHLRAKWRELFGAKSGVRRYDLTSTYFETDTPDDPADPRRHGYSRDPRPDCPQGVIALVVTPEGLPLAYEVLPGTTAAPPPRGKVFSKSSKRVTAKPNACGCWIPNLVTHVPPAALFNRRLHLGHQACEALHGSQDSQLVSQLLLRQQKLLQ